MENITQLANALNHIRAEEEKLKEIIKGIQENKTDLQEELIQAMKDKGLKSIKTETHNYARTVKKDIKVFSEEDVMEYLRNHGGYDEYVKPKLDTIKFKSYAKALLKETGEVMDGIELTEKEYMSIKANK